MSEQDDTYHLDRRTTLRALGAGAGAVASIGAFSGTAAAWDRFDVCFRGCSEVWMIVDWTDIGDGNAAYVIVSSGGQVTCHRVEFSQANATSIPGKFGDSPVVKYAPGGDYKILGVIEIDSSDGQPVDCVTVNENNCTTTPKTPSVYDATCVSDSTVICNEYSDHPGDYCGGTGGGSGNKGGGPP